jgi:NAD(P)-dependent dehydrogenase (short-subunit alcohol dehydrogenase family)
VAIIVEVGVLEGRTALVTGGSRGIGRVVALAYADAGADVAVASLDDAETAAVGAEIEARGGRSLAVACDVTNRDAVRAMVDSVVEHWGQLDIVVNNAGGTSPSTPLTELSFSQWQEIIDLNLSSVVHMCQAVAPHLRRREPVTDPADFTPTSTSVINVASIAALGAAPGLAPYSVSKAAVVSLTQTLAMEWAPFRIRVNALCPGWLATDLTRRVRDNPAASSAIAAKIPLGRWGHPEEMAGPALFLASDASSFMTGQTLVVDGGYTA